MGHVKHLPPLDHFIGKKIYCETINA